MGLATIDPHSQKEHAEISKSPSLVLTRLVLTAEIQAFKNGKTLQTNVWKYGQIRTFVRICPHFHNFFVILFVFKYLYLSQN